jgi:hypothetical protein
VTSQEIALWTELGAKMAALAAKWDLVSEENQSIRLRLLEAIRLLEKAEWAGRSADGLSFCCFFCRSYPDIAAKYEQPPHNEGCELAAFLGKCR